MPRGGARPGAGRKADPNSERQKKLAKRASAKAAGSEPAKARGRGFTLPDGQKAADAPPDWPFGTKPPEEPAQPPATEPDPDEEDGLTDEQRAGLSPLDYLLAVMRSPRSSKSARMTAAIQAAPYVHAKIAPAGKKEAKQEAAKKASRFAPAAPPRLAAAGGKRVD